MSRATITVTADDDEQLQRLLMRLQTRGVNMVDPGDAGVQHLPTWTASSRTASTPPPTCRPRIRLEGRWMTVENPEMDCGLIVERRPRSTRCRWPTYASA